MTNKKYVEEAPYHPGYEDAVIGDKGYEEKNLADAIRCGI